MIIACVGLPGSGKSYFAEHLAQSYPDFVVLSKDVVRSTLFPGDLTDYTREQDDFCIDVILKSAGMIMQSHPTRHVIIDGRTFSKRYQVQQVIDASRRMGIPCMFVLFTCSEETSRKRLAEGEGVHVAKDRDVSLYDRLKAAEEPLEVPHLTLVSDEQESLESRIQTFVQYVKEHDHG
jgi:adenylylsulfate kinase